MQAELNAAKDQHRQEVTVLRESHEFDLNETQKTCTGEIQRLTVQFEQRLHNECERLSNQHQRVVAEMQLQRTQVFLSFQHVLISCFL